MPAGSLFNKAGPPHPHLFTSSRHIWTVFLTAQNVFGYLERKRLATPADLVHGAYEVRTAARRNRNLRVRSGHRAFLIKQCRHWDDDHLQSLACEARCYWLAANDPAFVLLQGFLPACHGWDPGNSILILDLLPHQPLPERDDLLSPHWAASLSRRLAEWHQSVSAVAEDYDFPGNPPPWLSSPPEDSPDLPSGRRELLRAIDSFPEFRTALAAAVQYWTASTLIHGDLKLDNCLCDGREIRIVDWEMCSFGDPLWDLASLAQSYWNLWVNQPDRYPLSQVQPALRSLVEAYPGPLNLETLVRFGGARMLQSAFEAVGEGAKLNALSVRLMQAALNLLRDPHAAARELFGIAS